MNGSLIKRIADITLSLVIELAMLLAFDLKAPTIIAPMAAKIENTISIPSNCPFSSDINLLSPMKNIRLRWTLSQI